MKQMYYSYTPWIQCPCSHSATAAATIGWTAVAMAASAMYLAQSCCIGKRTAAHCASQAVVGSPPWHDAEGLPQQAAVTALRAAEKAELSAQEDGHSAAAASISVCAPAMAAPAPAMKSAQARCIGKRTAAQSALHVVGISCWHSEGSSQQATVTLSEAAMNSLTSEQATEVGGLGAAGLAGGGGVAAAVPSLEQAFSLSSPVQPGESVKSTCAPANVPGL